MAYASDLFRAAGHGQFRPESSPDDIPDLVAEILAGCVEERQRRRWTSGFQPRRDVLTRVRGRIDVLKTESHQLLARGRIACQFEELSVDTPRNRFVRDALETGARVATRPEVRNRCRMLARMLKEQGVAGIAPTNAALHLDQIGFQEVGDKRMLDAARLLMDLAIPSEAHGARSLPVAVREEAWVRRLFERAVGGFYAVTLPQPEWRVRTGSPWAWQVTASSSGIAAILPSMRTDIVLENLAAQRRLIIDTKFTAILKAGWKRDHTLHSGYVYQIYAYLRSQEREGDTVSSSAEGLMLHPTVGIELDEWVSIQGHRIRFATVDLASSGSEIAGRLRTLAIDCPGESGLALPGDPVVLQ